MINEHHTAPFCMQASINITGAILSKITKRAKILMLGNPLPVIDNPLRLAEELAMIDMISRGRLISGFVRGGGVESLANNVNPAHNRERFEEAHDVIMAAWTRPGPFRWEGKHFQYRNINPWALPLQKPHPPVMVPGTAIARDGGLGRQAPLSVRRARVVAGPDEGADRRSTARRRPKRATRWARSTSAISSACFVADTEAKGAGAGLQLLLAERRAQQADPRVDGAARLRHGRRRRHPPPARRLEGRSTTRRIRRRRTTTS